MMSLNLTVLVEDSDRACDLQQSLNNAVIEASVPWISSALTQVIDSYSTVVSSSHLGNSAKLLRCECRLILIIKS